METKNVYKLISQIGTNLSKDNINNNEDIKNNITKINESLNNIYMRF